MAILVINMDEYTLRLKECAEMLLDRLDFHGDIDIVREEGVIADLQNAINGVVD